MQTVPAGWHGLLLGAVAGMAGMIMTLAVASVLLIIAAFSSLMYPSMTRDLPFPLLVAVVILITILCSALAGASTWTGVRRLMFPVDEWQNRVVIRRALGLAGLGCAVELVAYLLHTRAMMSTLPGVVLLCVFALGSAALGGADGALLMLSHAGTDKRVRHVLRDIFLVLSLFAVGVPLLGIGVETWISVKTTQEITAITKWLTLQIPANTPTRRACAFLSSADMATFARSQDFNAPQVFSDCPSAPSGVGVAF